MATIPTIEDNDLETIYLIWLDASINKSKENLDAQQHIQSIINHLKIFENIQDCEEYIHKTSKDDRIFFIVNGQLGKEIVPRIHHYRQIFSIYVYCMNKKLNEEWAKNFAKIKGVITKLDHLLNQIQSDQLKRIENKVDDPLILTISQLNNFIDKSTNELNGEFLYSQLLIDCLLRMKSTLTDKNELINFCRIIYKNNFNELNIIKEFEENYLPNQALWWYTRESFLYRLLNKALRIKNIDLLFLFRFFIRDLENELKKSQCLSSIRVYRGQLMSIDELNQLQNSIGEYISINSFFSTSLNRQKAIKFLNDYSFSNNLHKVLFEIDANGELNHLKPFANISSISFYSNEQEILFMLGSIFRLMNIKQEKNGLWIIQMILSNNNDENLKILFDNIKSEYNGIDEETNLISFGNILYKMGKYDLAEKYFHRLLSDLPNDHHDISRCYHALGILALIKDNYELSLQWHNKSLKILKSNDSRLADSYNCIGCIYQKKEDFKNALEFYNKALIIWKNSLREDYYQIADCLNNMGCVYEMEKNYSKALECHQNALSIRKKYLPKDHPDLGGSYNNIGNIYLCLEQYDFALENYKYSYEIKLKSLPSQHSSLASTLENIGLVYEQKQLFEQALTYYEKAARIFRDTFLSTHIYVIEIEKDIQRVLSILNSPKISTKFKIEDLAIELWLEIFSYLKTQHQFNAFFNLNKRLNEILFSYRTRIICKNNDEDTQYLFKYILPYLAHQENVTELRLENTTKRNDLLDQVDLLYFPRLTKLILHRLNITQGLLNIFQQNTTYLRYLNISSEVSGNKKILHQLLEMIISLPNLQKCHLRLGISMSPIQLNISLKSPIKNLRLIGMEENCITDRLIVLLQYLPYLQSLHIIANQLNFNSTIKTKIIPGTNPISIFILNIKQFNVPFVQFANFILTLTPYVQELTIICRTPDENLTYLQHLEWISLIKLLSNLQKLTLRIYRANTINEQLWNKNCEQLTKIMTNSHIVLRIDK